MTKSYMAFIDCFFIFSYYYFLVPTRGQGHPAGNSPPYFGPSRKLDFELEMVSFLAHS